MTDLIEMIGNLSRSFFSLQHLISGFAYLLGIIFCIKALQKYRKIGGRGGGGHDSVFVPTAYLLGGAALLYLPTMAGLLSNTFFGVGNILQYTKYNPYSIYSAMILIIRTAGLVWFVRGCVLLSHASEPGVQEGPKGLMFLIAGILAMNIENTQAFLNWALSQLAAYTLSGTNPTSPK